MDQTINIIVERHHQQEKGAMSESIEEQIKEIEERNQRVEADKAWETSWTRRALLTVFTYLAIGVYMRAIDIPRAWLNAVVPAVAFMLSTLTMPLFKKMWLTRRSRRKKHSYDQEKIKPNAELG